MITIKTDNYILEQSDECCPMFDLKLKLPVIDKKTKNVDRYEFKQVGFGMPIDRCISKIAMYNIEYNGPEVKDINDIISVIQEENSKAAKEMKKEFFKQLKKNRK